MLTLRADTFEQWRDQARNLLAQRISPLDVTWADALQPGLFSAGALVTVPRDDSITVPPAFFALAITIACHRDTRRWDLLYQLLFRLTHGEKHLMKISTDPLTHALERMEQSIRRDAHKAKAFVRFRKVEDNEGEHYIAWHNPDHRILPLVAPFFSRRFSSMRWTILTPDQSVRWDGEELTYGPGVPASEAPYEDTLEDLWREYYRATFNPARIKLKMMKREMPVRHWKTLPETQIIADMLAEAPARIETMLKHTEGSTRSAAEYVPVEQDIASLRAAACACKGCDLHEAATQTVFGEGPENATIMIVGEQPGNDEDLAGRPFIGPAGEVLDEALERAGLQRADLYITNAVKHFRFLYKDSFRQHQSPSRYHVQACKPWLKSEIAAIKPRLVICLGNTAARSLIHPNFIMRDGRGQLLRGQPNLFATYHPSAILRAPRAAQAAMRHEFMQDMTKASALVKQAA